MPDPGVGERNLNWSNGFISLGLALVCLIIAFYGLSKNTPLLTLVMALFAIFVGHAAFNYFQAASQPGPDPIEVHAVETFVSSLKDGSDVTFVIEIHYEMLKQSSTIPMQINIRILRRLNEYLPTCEEIYPDPLNTTDRIIQQDIPSLSKELKLKDLTLRTIDVKGRPPSVAHRSQGIYFGEHMQ